MISRMNWLGSVVIVASLAGSGRLARGAEPAAWRQLRFCTSLRAGYSHHFPDTESGGGASIEAAVGYRIVAGLGIELRVGFQIYGSAEVGYLLPLIAGLRYDVWLGNRFFVSPFAGIGPVAVAGSDWGGVFAEYSGGVRASVRVLEQFAVQLTFEHAVNMLGHPSAFHTLKVMPGISLLF